MQPHTLDRHLFDRNLFPESIDIKRVLEVTGRLCIFFNFPRKIESKSLTLILLLTPVTQNHALHDFLIQQTVKNVQTQNLLESEALDAENSHSERNF